MLSKNKKNITICHIFTAVTYRNILYGRVIIMHVETASSLFDMRGSRKFSRGGVTFRPGWVQLHNSGVIINLSKWVDHGTDSYFWYIQKTDQDLMILINLSPQIIGLLWLYFPLSREIVMIKLGTISIRLGRLL